MKTKQTTILICMVIAGLIYPVAACIAWMPLVLAIALDFLPYVLLPIAAYVGMKNGFSSKWTLTLNIITCMSIIIDITLSRFVPLWWNVHIPGVW